MTLEEIWKAKASPEGQAKLDELITHLQAVGFTDIQRTTSYLELSVSAKLGGSTYSFFIDPEENWKVSSLWTSWQGAK